MTWYPIQSHYPNTKRTNPCPILIMQNIWLWSKKYQFESLIWCGHPVWLVRSLKTGIYPHKVIYMCLNICICIYTLVYYTLIYYISSHVNCYVWSLNVSYISSYIFIYTLHQAPWQNTGKVRDSCKGDRRFEPMVESNQWLIELILPSQVLSIIRMGQWLVGSGSG